MLYVITGGSGSGKSEYAEKLAVERHRRDYPDGRLYYIATMNPGDEECVKRIARHQKMRQGKGFGTLECFVRLERLLPLFKKQDVLLLECMSNLLANEMYAHGGRITARDGRAEEQLEEAVLRPVRQLADYAGHVVVVTNEVFSDGICHDKETEAYIRLLGHAGQSLAAAAGGVAEVVCSVPLALKGELPC